MEIHSKRKFYDMWQAGLLGNRPLTWSNAAQAAASGHTLFGVREVGKAGGGKFALLHSAAALLEETAKWDREGRRYNIDGGVPNDLVQLQAEVCRTERGLEGFVAIRSGTNVREALARGLFRPESGARLHALLRYFMDPASRDDLDALLELFPNAAVELACFSRNVGVIPGRNVIIWEVRNY